MRCLVLCCLLLACSAESVDALFERAAGDPAAMVPLAQEVGRQLADLEPEAALALADRAQPYLERLYFSNESFPGMDALGLISYTVQSGDSFDRIARNHRVGRSHLQLMNPDVRPSAMQVGQRLKVLDCSQERLRVYVWRGRFRCMVMRGGGAGGLQLLASYPIGTGMVGRETPTGVSSVTVMQLDPVWTDPDTKEVFQPGDPGNVLNGFWIGLDPVGGRFQSIGFHGYSAAAEETWLETQCSRGCIRMRKDDIARLYDLIVPGTKVAVLP